MIKHSKVQCVVGILAMVTGSASASMLVLAQNIPSIPEDFKSWPITAILGLITLASLGLVFYLMCRVFSTIVAASEKAGGLQAAANLTNDKLTELCAKIDEVLKKA
jgi:hypothetical protein